MKKFFTIILLNLSFAGKAQNDSLRTSVLPEVTVTTYVAQPVENTSVNITSVNVDSLSKTGNFNLTDMLTKTPGVNMLSTGVAIAKPVIRGLYGNRILILISGLKFDNQQWQEEHGLGLSDIGLSKAEIIKGPLGVLYGTEAMGGIINLVNEQKANAGERETDVSIKLNSNTRGGIFQAGYKFNKGNKWFGIRAAVENNADYSDGKNKRVLNSRFDGYYLKSTLGFKKRRWVSVNNYSGSYNRFGFIFNDVYNYITPDKRWSRDMQTKPAHLVLLNMVSSENKFQLRKSILNINAGIQSNVRMEKEGGGSISLNMHLFTAQYLAKWEKTFNEKNKLIISNLGSFEDNTNYGARKIIPDANMIESNISAYYQTGMQSKWKFENGIGVGEKSVKTFFTAGVNSPEKDIRPFKKNELYYNIFSGLSFVEKKFNLKLNAATGVRIPNLAELSSNGLHEGVFNYEIGSPLLKNEKNVTLNLLAHYADQKIDISISPFFNYFFNYVYLSPTTEDWYGFPVFRYLQQDARQYGTEFNFSVQPALNFQTGISYSGMISKTTDGAYTPFQPAQKISPFLNYNFKTKDKTISSYINLDHLLSQNNIYPGEISTPAYSLLNAGISAGINNGNCIYEFSLAGNNLLNTAYYDHLSRFKYFGLLNIGRNVVLMFKIKHRTKIKR